MVAGMDDPAFDMAMQASFDAAFGAITFSSVIIVALVRNGALKVSDVTAALTAQKAVIDLAPEPSAAKLDIASLQARFSDLRARLADAGHTLPPIAGLEDQ
jgi:hypothetical protein